MIIKVFEKDEHICTVTITDDKHILVENYSGKINFYVPYITRNDKVYEIDYPTLDKFLESRCFSRHRIDLDELLKKYGLKYYSPMGICRKSHGVKVTDFTWMSFDDERLRWDDVRIK